VFDDKIYAADIYVALDGFKATQHSRQTFTNANCTGDKLVIQWSIYRHHDKYSIVEQENVK